MADYKRLVSYIYAYPGGVRDKNVGFAKAEVRNGQFKLTVSVKGVYTDTPELFGVYVMVDGKKHQPGGFTLLKTGTVMVNQGIGQYQDLFNQVIHLKISVALRLREKMRPFTVCSVCGRIVY